MIKTEKSQRQIQQNQLQDNENEINDISYMIYQNLNFNNKCYLYENNKELTKKLALKFLKQTEDFLFEFQKKIQNTDKKWMKKNKVLNNN